VLLFNVLPQAVDIAVACAYLSARTTPWAAVVLLFTVGSYLPLTVIITERRGKACALHTHACMSADLCCAVLYCTAL
jgi:ABC-type transport system involved in Fe-S cluster assembly fused permease/ATPase subunit